MWLGLCGGLKPRHQWGGCGKEGAAAAETRLRGGTVFHPQCWRCVGCGCVGGLQQRRRRSAGTSRRPFDAGMLSLKAFLHGYPARQRVFAAGCACQQRGLSEQSLGWRTTVPRGAEKFARCRWTAPGAAKLEGRWLCNGASTSVPRVAADAHFKKAVRRGPGPHAPLSCFGVDSRSLAKSA